MRTQHKLLAVMAAAIFAAAPVHADPPSGKGNSNQGNSGKGNSGKGNSNQGNSGNSQNNGNNGNNGNQGQRSNSGVDTLDVVISSLVAAGITQSYARNLAVTNGLTGYQGLPPGIQKNLARGKPLPPGIAKKMVPGPMLAKLPQYPGYEWRAAGTELILVNLVTLGVVEVLKSVFD